MTKEIYNRLAQALNMRSTAYPSIPCEEFYALAAELLTPEQAEIAASMPVEPVSTGKLAARMKTSDIVGLGRQLDEMTDRGLVRVKEEARNRLYELMPLVPGIIELQFMHGRSDDRTKRLAQLFKSYGKAVKNMLPTGPVSVTVEKPRSRTIVISQEIHSKTTVLPYDEVMKLVDKTEYIAARTCVCRHQGDLLGRPCDKPKDNLCMIFGASAQFAQRYGFVNLISKEEARQKIDEAEKAGLVHNYANSQNRYIDLYLVNLYRSADDPEKEDIDITGIVLTPLWPFQLIFGLAGTIFKAILFGIALLLFTVCAVVIRKPFIWRWIEPIILGIGNRMMKINTFLIRLFAKGSSKL